MKLRSMETDSVVKWTDGPSSPYSQIRVFPLVPVIQLPYLMLITSLPYIQEHSGPAILFRYVLRINRTIWISSTVSEGTMIFTGHPWFCSMQDTGH